MHAVRTDGGHQVITVAHTKLLCLGEIKHMGHKSYFTERPISKSDLILILLAKTHVTEVEYKTSLFALILFISNF